MALLFYPTLKQIKREWGEVDVFRSVPKFLLFSELPFHITVSYLFHQDANTFCFGCDRKTNVDFLLLMLRKNIFTFFIILGLKDIQLRHNVDSIQYNARRKWQPLPIRKQSIWKTSFGARGAFQKTCLIYCGRKLKAGKTFPSRPLNHIFLMYSYQSADHGTLADAVSSAVKGEGMLKIMPFKASYKYTSVLLMTWWNWIPNLVSQSIMLLQKYYVAPAAGRL